MMPRDEDRVFDVSRPHKTAPDATSKPIIVGHHPIMNDPMVTMDRPTEPPHVDQPSTPIKVAVSMEDNEPAKKASFMPPQPLPQPKLPELSVHHPLAVHPPPELPASDATPPTPAFAPTPTPPLPGVITPDVPTGAPSPLNDLPLPAHHGGLHQSSNKSRKKWLFVSFLLVLLLGAGAYAFTLKNKTPVKPTSNSAVNTPVAVSETEAASVFNKMIDYALSTSSFTQHTTITSQASSATANATEESTTHFDVADLAKPHLDVSLNDKFPPKIALAADYVLNAGDGYAKMLGLSGDMAAGLNKLTPPFSSYLNKWFPITQNGKAINDVSSQTLADLDTLNSLDWGNFIFGNLSASQRKDVEDFIVSSKVYSYDATKVEKQTVNSQQFYVYQLKIDDSALLQLNQKVMSYFNVQMTNSVKQSITSFQADKVEWWVSADSGKLTKVITHLTGNSPGSSTTTYSAYDNTKVAAVPQLQLTASDSAAIFVGFYAAGL